MAKFIFTLSIGLVGAKRENDYEIDDEDFKGLSDDERDELVGEHWKEWSDNYISGGWEEVE